MSKIFKICLIFISFALSFPLSAQQRKGGPSKAEVDRFKAEKNAFLVQEVGITSEEAGLFFPLYEEMQNKIFELQKNTRIKSRALRNNPNVTAEQYKAAVFEMIRQDCEKAKIEEEYYKKFEKILSPEKLYKLKMAENKFAVHLFHRRGNNNKSPGNK